MSAVLLAVFNDYESAEHVRVALVRDGFPTDRVELTAADELGRAAFEPAKSAHDKCVQYFATLLSNPDEKHYPEMLAERVDKGAAVVTVLPRGAIETERAAEILQQARPAEVVGHDLADHGWEHAASRSEGFWIQHVWLEASPETDCLYCRLFPGRSHAH
ncbi:MAG: hypothetical protein JO173_06620 [Gammaproteobacteria bacterium]|nr:hypothetical protein [Gammaproteobacteria bacterium]